MLRTVIAAAFCALALTAPATAAEPPQITDGKLSTVVYGAETVLYWLDKMPQGDLGRAQRLAVDLDRLRASLASVQGADAGQVAALDAYLLALGADLVAKAQPVAANSVVLPQGTMKPGSNAIETPKPAAATVSDGISSADATALVNEIMARYGNDGPLELPQPHRFFKTEHITKPDAEALVAFIRDYSVAVETDLPRLQAAYDATGKGEYWLRWIREEGLAQFEKDLARYLKGKSDMTERELQRAEKQAGFTPDKNASELRGDFAANTIARNAKVLETMAAAGYLEFAFGLEQTQAGRAEKLAVFAAAYEDTVAMVAAGLTSEMPQDLGDAGLTDIAETVLGKPRYDITGWEKMAVVSNPTSRDRIEHRVWNGKIEAIVRVWDEFQVTTAERGEDGTIRLYHNTIAKFSRAPSTTPVGEWILMLRHEGSPIAEDRL